MSQRKVLSRTANQKNNESWNAEGREDVFPRRSAQHLKCEGLMVEETDSWLQHTQKTDEESTDDNSQKDEGEQRGRGEEEEEEKGVDEQRDLEEELANKSFVCL